jgi:thioredoxin reductase (NADPH)
MIDIENNVEKTDIVIIGAGPAGISCALTACKQNYHLLLIDQGNVANAIIRFPINMVFFSTADQLELAGIPLILSDIRPTRIEMVKYYQSIIRMFKIPVLAQARVLQVKYDGSFETRYRHQNREKVIRSSHVILATGFYDQPNLLNIPGEDLPAVHHYYREPYAFFGQQVVVVGGGNSAVEAALELYRHGARVILVYRGAELGDNIKYWIKPDIQNRLKENNIRSYFRSTVEKITANMILIRQADKIIELPMDAVFLLTGYHPPAGNFQMCQVEFDRQTLVPEYNRDTLESNVPGLYLAGSVMAGNNTNTIFIENSREHGSIIITDIDKKYNRSRRSHN